MLLVQGALCVDKIKTWRFTFSLGWQQIRDAGKLLCKWLVFLEKEYIVNILSHFNIALLLLNNF